jgi:hypothetical protein
MAFKLFNRKKIYLIIAGCVIGVASYIWNAYSEKGFLSKTDIIALVLGFFLLSLIVFFTIRKFNR